MIRIEQIDPSHTAEHLAALKAHTLTKLAEQFAKLPAAAQTTQSAALKTYLDTNIESLLTGTPRQLRRHIKYFQNNFSWFDHYAKTNPGVRSSNYDATKRAIVAAVRKAFDYDAFSKKRTGWCAYRLVKVHELRLCPYCNLNHVNFHGGSKKIVKGVKVLNMRPPLDHYFPRSAYPYLGISIHNLIPSCHQCNSSVKHDEDPAQHSLPHPFHFPRNALTFTVDNILSYANPVDASVIKIIIDSKKRAALEHAKFFELPARYGWYAHEIADVHRRFLDYVKVDPALAASLDSYILLGYKNAEGERRALGLCLHDIVTDWIQRVPR